MTIGQSRRLSIGGVAIIATVLLGLTGWVVINSAFFDVRQVRIEGTRHLSEDEVRRLSGIELGDNLVRLETEEVVTLLEQHPWILEAEIARDLPSTAVVRVLERRPIGWVEGANGDGVAIVARDGTVLSVGERVPEKLPALGSSDDLLAVGATLGDIGPPLGIASTMSPFVLRAVTSISVAGSEIFVEIRGGATARYGTATDLDAKNRALDGMLRWADEEGVAPATIDVRAPGAPSLDPRGPQGETSPNASP